MMTFLPNTSFKKRPIGVQTFSAIREDNDVYIDKTPLAHQMGTIWARNYFCNIFEIVFDRFKRPIYNTPA